MKKKGKYGPQKRLTAEQKAELFETIRRRDLTVEQVAASVGVSARTIRRWRIDLERSEETTPLTSAERRRLRQLEREVAELKLQLEIKKKQELFSRRTKK
jgi:transposase-like protein